MKKNSKKREYKAYILDIYNSTTDWQKCQFFIVPDSTKGGRQDSKKIYKQKETRCVQWDRILKFDF